MQLRDLRPVVLLLACECASGTSQPTTPSRRVAAPAPISSSAATIRRSATVEQQAPGTFAGKADQPNLDGRVYSLDQQPYAFAGRLEHGNQFCEESIAITFANVRSLGLRDSQCEFDVKRLADERKTVWSSTCELQVSEHRTTSIRALIFADEIVLGRDGKTPFRPTLYLDIAKIADEPLADRECRYVGNTVERKYLQPE